MEELTSPARFPNSDRADMNDLIDHLNKMLDQDEGTAQAATRGPWRYEVFRRDGLKSEWVLSGTSDPYGVIMGDVGIGWMANTGVPNPEHIARHDPARVLREVAALRRIIDDYRIADRACMGADAGDPSYATIRAGRDAFKSVLQTYAEASGWRPSR